MNKVLRLLRHLWFDTSDTCRTIPDDMARRLAERIAASESRHSGEVRLCVEAALPMADLWRVSPGLPLATVIRERALEWFGRLGVWDTEHNNGVLIYLLLAEHTIEIVADRGLAQLVPAEEWQAMVGRLSAQLRAGAFEDGLTAALAEVSVHLVRHFPESATAPTPVHRPNQLADSVIRA